MLKTFRTIANDFDTLRGNHFSFLHIFLHLNSYFRIFTFSNIGVTIIVTDQMCSGLGRSKALLDGEGAYQSKQQNKWFHFASSSSFHVQIENLNCKIKITVKIKHRRRSSRTESETQTKSSASNDVLSKVGLSRTTGRRNKNKQKKCKENHNLYLLFFLDTIQKKSQRLFWERKQTTNTNRSRNCGLTQL